MPEQKQEKPWGQLPASLHENVFAVPRGFENDPKVTAARNVLKDGRLTAERARKIAREVLADEMLTQVARHKTASDRITALTKPSLERFDKAIEGFGKEMERLEEELQGPDPKLDYRPLRFLEVRQALASLPREERRKIVLAAIKDGDDVTVAAVTRYPAYLSALSNEEREDFRRRWAAQHRPNEVARLAMLKDVVGHVERGGQLLLSYTVGLTDHRIVEQAEARLRRVREAEAAGAPTATLQ